MARPRSVSDQAILEGVARAVARLGPVEVGVRDIAAEAGLAASTLIQRFGSRRRLLRSYAESRMRRRREVLERLPRDGNPLDTLERALVEIVDPAESPRASAHLLAFDQLFLADDEFREEAARQGRRLRRELRRLLRKAVKQKLLRRKTDVRSLARVLHLTLQGCTASWPLYRRKSLADWVRREIRDLLAQHRRR